MSRSNCVDSLSHSFRYSIAGCCVCAAILFFSLAQFVFYSFRGISLFRVFALIPYTLTRSLAHSLIRSQIDIIRPLSSVVVIVVVICSSFCALFSMRFVAILDKMMICSSFDWIMANVSHHYVVFFLFVLFFCWFLNRAWAFMLSSCIPSDRSRMCIEFVQ